MRSAICTKLHTHSTITKSRHSLKVSLQLRYIEDINLNIRGTASTHHIYKVVAFENHYTARLFSILTPVLEEEVRWAVIFICPVVSLLVVLHFIRLHQGVSDKEYVPVYSWTFLRLKDISVPLRLKVVDPQLFTVVANL